MTDEQRTRVSSGHMGQSAWNKGIPWSAEAKAKMSESHMGHFCSAVARANESKAKMGHPTYPETREKISASLLGHPVLPESRTKMSIANTGHTQPPEIRAKISLAMWRGGPRMSRAKRRALGFTELNSPFVGCEGHHISLSDVIYIPKEMHRSVAHNVWTGKNMEKINLLAGAYMTEGWT